MKMQFSKTSTRKQEMIIKAESETCTGEIMK